MSATLIEAARDLAEAVESMQATFGCIQGKTPEDDDLHIHEKWAEEFLAERLANLRTALAAAEAQQAPTTIFTAGHVKRLADKMALAKAACDIPNGDLWRSITQDRYADARQELFDAIDALASGAAAEAQPVGEPVAWMFHRRYGSGVQFPKPESYTDEDGNECHPTPLYAAPPAQPAAQPLTDEQIDEVHRKSYGRHRIGAHDFYRVLAREVERAHGIGSQP